MYQDCKAMAKKAFGETDQILYFTPALFLNMFSNFKRLFHQRKKNVEDIQKRYENGLESLK